MNLHPVIVHFPIALLVVAALLATISLFIKKESWKEWMFKNLVLGLAFVPLAIIAGIIEEQNLQHNEAIHSVLTIHKYNGFVVLIIYSILTIWFWRRKNSIQKKEYTAWVLCLLLATGLLSYQGYLGGKMVFDLGAGVKPMEASMMKGHDHGSEDESLPSHSHADDDKQASDSSSHPHNSKMKEHKHDEKEVADSTDAQKKKKELKDMKY
jgi:uncharacterized membrane protein